MVEEKPHARYASCDPRIHSEYCQIETPYGVKNGTGHGGECRETEDGREFVVPQGDSEKAEEKKGHWEKRDGRK